MVASVISVKKQPGCSSEYVEGDEGVIGSFWRDTFKGWRIMVHEHYANGRNPIVAASSRTDAIEQLTMIWSRTHFGSSLA